MAPALAAALAGLPCPASAQDGPRQETVHFYTWENDSRFVSDRFYTSGVELSAKHGTDRRGDFARDFTYSLCRFAGCDASTLFANQRNVGQMIFTPRRIKRVAPQPGDRPWAGLLYYEKMYSFLSHDQQTLTTITGQLGVTGRLSLAEDAQKAVHRLMDRARPMGWHNQIGGSLGVMASVEKRTAIQPLSFDLPAGVRFNTAAYWRLAAGTIQTYAALGVAVVLGKDLPAVSPPPPGINSHVAARTAAAPRLSCLVKWLRCTAFASVEARSVAYNVLLDGRPFQDDDPSVDKRRFVYQLVIGNRFDLPRTRTRHNGPWFLQTKVTRRSPEFRSHLSVPGQSVYAVTFGSEF